MDKQAAEIILGKAGYGDGFTLRHLGFKLHLRIRPLTARQIIEISHEVCQLKDPDPEKPVFPEEINKADNLRYIARAITIATNTKFPGLIYRAILKLDLDSLATLWGAVIKNSNPSAFFFITGSAKGLNKIRTEPVK